MIVNISLDHIITQKELLSIYKTFCECYAIDIDAKDEERFSILHYDMLIEQNYIDHRPFMGAKFFGTQYKNHEYSFQGYNDCLDETKRERSGQEFRTRVEKQFNKSPN